MNTKNRTNRDSAEKAVRLANLAGGIFPRKIVRPGMLIVRLPQLMAA